MPGKRSLGTRMTQCAAALAMAAMVPLAPPAVAQGTAAPGTTINGTVPTSEGNVWNGLDHQPTAAEAPPIGNARQQARVSHKMQKLDQQLLNDPLPKVPSDAPSVAGQ